MGNKLEANSRDVELLLEKTTTLEIPIYQRSYAWDETQTLTLMSDFWDSFKKENELQYFLGNIVTKDNENGKAKIIVDGQQRLTTLTLLFFSLGNFVNDTSWDEKIKEFHLQNLKYYIYKKPKEVDKEEFALKLESSFKNKTLESFLKNMNPFDKKEEESETIGSNYSKNYKSIKKYLESKIFNSSEYQSFFEWLTKKVALVEIELPNNVDEQKIFESINAEGVGLTSVDLIKNFLYSRIEKTTKNNSTLKKALFEKTEKIFEETLTKLDRRTKLDEKVFNSYISYDTCKSVKEEDKAFYKLFKEYYDNKNSYAEMIEELSAFTSIYVQISNIKITKLADDFSLSFYLTKQTILGVLYPIVFELFKHSWKNDYKIESDENFKYFVKNLERYTTVRYLDCKSNRNYNKFFIEQKILPELKNYNFIKGTLDEIASVTKERIHNLFESDLIKKENENDTTTLANYNEEKIKKKFFNSSDYESNPSGVMHVLTKYEFLLKNGSESTSLADSKNWSIEHIFPQNPEMSSDWFGIAENESSKFEGLEPEDIIKKYIHKWGNLTIMDIQDNKKNSNSEFSVKKKNIDNSILRVNNYLKTFESWNFEDIITRQELMWDVIWKSLKDKI